MGCRVHQQLLLKCREVSVVRYECTGFDQMVSKGRDEREMMLCARIVLCCCCRYYLLALRFVFLEHRRPGSIINSSLSSFVSHQTCAEHRIGGIGLGPASLVVARVRPTLVG